MKPDYSEKRKYIRLDTVFPIEFQLVDKDRNPISPVFQGFTRNVGKGGMCIEAKAEKNKDEFQSVTNQAKVNIFINIPTSHLVTKSFATIKWANKVSEYFFDTYTFGVEYEEIESDNQRMIENHVRWLHRRPKVILIFFLALLVFLVALVYFGVRPRLQ